MADDFTFFTDRVHASLNETPAPDADAKGPDPAQWPVEGRETEPEFVDADLKGPNFIQKRTEV